MEHDIAISKATLNRTFARIAGVIVAAVGAAALLGWSLHNHVLKGFHPSFVEMKANTAAAFLLAGISLFLKADPKKRALIADICAGAVALIGLLTLCEYVFAVNLRIDQMLFREPPGATLTVIPGRMAPYTAIAFFLAGLGLLFQKIELRKTRPADFLMLIAGLIGFFAALAYIFGTATLYGYSRFTAMSLPASVSFMLLCLGGLISNPRRRISSVFASGGVYDKTDRRMTYGFVLVFAFIMTMIVLAGCFYCRNYEKNYRDELSDRLGAIATLQEGVLFEYRKEQIGDADLLFKNISISRLVRRFLKNPHDDDAKRQLQGWVDKYKSHNQFNIVRLVDPQGVTHMSAPASLPPMSSAAAKRIPEILRSGEIVFQDFYRSEHDQRVYLAVLVPVFDESGGGLPLGAFVLRIDPTAYLYPFIQNWPTPSRTGETLIVRRDGNYALFLNEFKNRKNTALNLRISLEKEDVVAVKAALGKKGVETGVDYRGEPVLADTRAIQGSPWFLVTKMDLSEAYAPLRAHLQLIVGFIGVLLLCVSACIGFVWQMWKTRFLREHYAAAAALRESAALRASEIQYRRLFESAKDGILILDAETGMVNDVNPFLVELLGYSHEKFQGKAIWELGFFKDIIANKDHFEKLQSKEYIRYEDLPLETSDGRRIDVEFISNAYLVNNHKVIQCNIRDITEHKRADEALRESERRLREAQAMGRIGNWEYDIPARSIQWSEQAYALYERDPALGPPNEKEEAAFYSAEQAGIIREYGRRAIEEGTSFEYDIDAFLPSGKKAHFLATMRPVKDDNGRVVRLLGTVQDITERKRAEIELAESEIKYRTLFEHSSDGVLIADVLTKRFVIANNKICEMLGYSLDELLALGVENIHPVDDLPHVLSEFEAQARGEKTLAENVPCMRKDGSIFFVDIGVGPFEMGGRLYKMGMFRDITRRKRAQEDKEHLMAQLNQAQKMESVGRLAGGVAHDFNNMLGVIIGTAQLAMMKIDPADAIYEDFNEILNAAERSADLTRQLLAFARKQTVAPVPMNLNDAVAGMIKMLQRLIGEDIDLVWSPGHNLWKVKIDPSQIDQILANLAVNARDAIAGVGKVTLETENIVCDEAFCVEHAEFVSGEYVRLSISDNGCGMDRETSDHIFEPFYTTKETGKGTGLGLATVFGIVRQNNGLISAYSEPGMGTTFKILLPRFADEAGELPAHGEENALPGGSELVLIVEDEAAILSLGRRILEKLGYSVLAALTAAEAISLFEERADEIQLLITDTIMPDMNGKELAERLISLKPGLKCLYMSGYTADVIAHHGVLDENVHFVQKPFTVENLAHKVRETLDG